MKKNKNALWIEPKDLNSLKQIWIEHDDDECCDSRTLHITVFKEGTIITVWDTADRPAELQAIRKKKIIIKQIKGKVSVR